MQRSRIVRLSLFLLILIAGFELGARLVAQEPPSAPPVAQEPAAPPVAPEPAAAPEAEIATAPVQLDGVTLFRVRGVSSFPADVRASAIQDRLIAVARNSSVPTDSLRAVESNGMMRILGGSVAIMAVVDADASMEQVGRAELAASHVSRLQTAITDYRAARTPSARIRGAVGALAATLVFAAAIWALLWFWRWIERVFTRRLEAKIHSVEIQSFELVRAESIATILRTGLLALRTILLLAIALVYLGFMLAQFPMTRGLSRNIVTFAIGPLQVMGAGLVAQIPSLVFLTVLYFVVRLTLRLVRLFFHAVRRGGVKLEGFDPDWADPTYNLVRIAVVAFALIVAYPYIPGSSSDAFRGISLFMGVLVSLGSSSAISNTIAGYMLTYRRALKVGDRVRIGTVVGDVTNVRLQVTHLRSVKNEEITLPNSLILAGEVLNYSSLTREHGLILHTQIGVGYDTPWRQVEALLLAAADRTDGLSREPRPFVLEKELTVFAVTYELNAYCNNAQAMFPIYSELHRQILDVFNEAGVQIMVPAYEGDPPEPKIVARKDWHAAPAQKPAASG